MKETDVIQIVDGRVSDFHSLVTMNNTPRHPLKKLLSEILPVYLLDQIKFELHMLYVRLKAYKSYKRYVGKKNLLVNIGAGDSGREGWVNLDGFPEVGVNCLVDARKRLPFEDNSVQ